MRFILQFDSIAAKRLFKALSARHVRTFMVGVSLLALSLSALSDTVSIRADEWSPVNNDPRATHRGIMIEVAEAILAEAGHQVDYKIMKWQEAMDSVRAGQEDCVVGALRGDVPEGFLLPKQPWVVSKQTVYARADRDYRINSINDLSAYRLGVSGDYSYGEDLDKYRDANLKDPSKIYVARSNRPVRDLLLRLNTSQIQLALETSVVMDFNIGAANLVGRIKAVGTPVNKAEELFIACSAAKKTSAGYIALFDRGFPKLRSSGQFAQILKHYNVSDWQ